MATANYFQTQYAYFGERLQIILFLFCPYSEYRDDIIASFK